MRLSWDKYFMSIAYVARERSTCLRRKVGAVLTKRSRIIATGYNGSPIGYEHCCDTGKCIREIRGIKSGELPDITMAVHAEVNCIYSAALMGIATEGAIIYCTTFPCVTCLKAIIQSGIVEVVWSEEYDDNFSRALVAKSKLKFRRIVI